MAARDAFPIPSATIRNLADVRALETIPLEQRIGVDSTYELIGQSASLRAGQVALVFLPDGRLDAAPVEISYEQLFGRITQTANLLHDLGVGPTDVVSYLLPNRPETEYVLWGAEAAGIVAPVNHLLEPPQIVGLLNAIGTKVLVAQGPVGTSELWAKAMAVRHRVPTLRAIVQVGGAATDAAGVYHFESWLGRYPTDRLQSGRRIARQDVAAYFHTGGTTGLPKIAPHTHWNTIAQIWQNCVAYGIEPDEVMLLGMPLYHTVAALFNSLCVFARGGKVIMLGAGGYRTPGVVSNLWRIVERFRATQFSAVPTIVARLCDVPLDGADVSSVRNVGVGAAALPVEVARRFRERTGLRTLEGYGLTEATQGCAVNPRDGERRPGSAGIPRPYADLKIVRLDANGAYLGDCPSGEVGVIVTRGPNVFSGYLQPQFNDGLWIAHGWLITGDLGRIDEDGYLWVTGRAKDVIIRGGHNIDAAVIEEPLHRHPAVALCAAVGKPDADAGELPVAYVSLQPQAAATADELLAFARAQIAERAAVPKEIFIVRELPLTGVGKVHKAPLRMDAARRALQGALGVLADEGISADVELHATHQQEMLATVRVHTGRAEGWAAAEARVREVLGRFSVAFEIFSG
jgi:fatty-acyl-CoA synthase